MEKKGFMKKVLSKRVLEAFQVISSLLLLFFVYRLNVLPFKYFIVFVVAIVILFLIPYMMMRGKKNSHGVRRVFGKLVSIAISIILLVAAVYTYEGNNFFSNFGIGYEIHSVSIIALKDDSINDVKGIVNKDIGMSSKTSGVVLTNAVEVIEKEIDSSLTNVTDYKNFTELAKGLYDKEVDVIILNEANRSMIKEEYPNFDKDTKVIYQTETKEKLENTYSDTNVTEETFNILISGNDTYGELGKAGKSDVNMLATVNPKTKQILLTSIPRDSYVELGTIGHKDKLTHAGVNGVMESCKTVEKLFDCKVDYYFRINFTSLTEIVDALGGIVVDNPVEFYNSADASSGGPRYTFEKGEIELDGEKALIFSRERQVLPNADFDRGQNQQRIIKAIIKKACSSTIITHYNKVLDSVSGAFDTNLSESSIKSFIQMQLGDMAEWDIQNTQLEGYPTRSWECYYGEGSNLSVVKPYDLSIKAVSKYIEDLEKSEERIKVETVSYEGTETILKQLTDD